MENIGEFYLTYSSLDILQYVFNNGQMDLERLKALVRVVGRERLVLDLSCRKKVLKQKFISLHLLRLIDHVSCFIARHTRLGGMLLSQQGN